jgi:hypothetical protein
MKRARARVVCLTAAIITLDVALLLLLAGDPPPYPAALGVVAVTALFAAAEMAPLHLRVGSQRHTISFNEIPLALGALFLRPGLFVLAVVIGSGIALAWQRRQRGAKLIFNLAQLVAQAVVVVGAVHVCAGALSTPLAIGIALVAADTVSCALVSCAIACQQGSFRGVVTRRLVVVGTIEALTKAAIAVAGVAVIVNGMSLLAAVVLLGAATILLASRLSARGRAWASYT